jgi:hypothetical protein
MFVGILVLTGVFFMFRPAGLQLGSGFYFTGSFGTGDTGAVVSAPSIELDFEIRSIIELEDRTLRIDPAAIVLVDGSSKTASRGRTGFLVAPGNHTIEIRTGFWPWQIWRSYVALNKTTTMYAEFHTIDMRPDFITATTDAVQGFSNVNFTSSLVARSSSYLEGIRLAYYPADVIFFDILARSTDPVLGGYEGEPGVEFYNTFVLKKLNPGFNSVAMNTDVRRPIAMIRDARISYHYSEVKAIEEQ